MAMLHAEAREAKVAEARGTVENGKPTAMRGRETVAIPNGKMGNPGKKTNGIAAHGKADETEAETSTRATARAKARNRQGMCSRLGLCRRRHFPDLGVHEVALGRAWCAALTIHLLWLMALAAIQRCAGFALASCVASRATGIVQCVRLSLRRSF
jgi:hypothetical protein